MTMLPKHGVAGTLNASIVTNYDRSRFTCNYRSIARCIAEGDRQLGHSNVNNHCYWTLVPVLGLSSTISRPLFGNCQSIPTIILLNQPYYYNYVALPLNLTNTAFILYII